MNGRWLRFLLDVRIDRTSYAVSRGLCVVAVLGLLLAACGGSGSGGESFTAPSIAAQPADRSVTAGEAVSFSVSAVGSAPLAFQWQSSSDGVSFASIAGASTSTYAIASTTSAMTNTLYRVVVSNGAGSVTSSAARLTVTPALAAPAFTAQPADQTSLVGASATFSVTVTGTPPPTLQWQQSIDGGINWTNIPAAASSSYTTPTLTTTDDGKRLRVIATNSAGSVNSAVAKLTVNTAPVVSKICSGPSESGWCWANPRPLGHNLNAIARVSETVMVAVGDRSTILRSTDSGQTWSPATVVTLNFFPQDLYGVAFADANNGTAVGAAEAILRTTDGGATWFYLASGTFQPRLNAVAYVTASTGFAVSAWGSVRRTNDGGQSWQFDSSPPQLGLNAVTFASASTGLAVGECGVVRRTTDGGQTWISFQDTTIACDSNSIGGGIGFRGAAFAGTAASVAVGDSGAIRRSSNGGQTWTQIASGTSQALAAVSFTGSDVGIAVGAAGTILRSGDGGQTWAAASSGTTAALRGVAFVNATTGVAVGESGTILRTTDGGLSWVALSSGVQTNADLRAIAFGNQSTGMVAGDAGTLLRTVDGGQAWAHVTSGTSSNLLGAAFATAAEGIVVGEVGTILRSNDAGQTWAPISSGLSASVALRSVSFASPSTGVAVGTSGTMLRTIDGGQSWVPIPSVTQSTLNAVSFSSATNGVAVGEFFTILRTADGGQSWALVTSGTGTPHLLSVTTAGPSASIALGGGSLGFRSTNGGLTWTGVAGDFAAGGFSEFRGVSFNGGNIGIAVGFGIARTTDSGQTWRALPRLTVRRINGVLFINPTTAVAVGESGTILVTTTGGI